MRIYVAVNDEKPREALSALFRREGYVVHAMPYRHADEVEDDIAYSDQYQAIVHDASLLPKTIRKIDVRLAFSAQGEGAACRLRTLSVLDIANDSPLLTRSGNKKSVGLCVRKLSYALSDRYNPLSFARGTFKSGPYAVDLMTRQASVAGQAIRTTAQEFGILRALCARQGRVVTHMQIADQVYDEDARTRDPYDTMKVHMSKLNRKIENTAGAQYRLELGHRGIVMPGISLAEQEPSYRIGPITFYPERHILACGDKEQRLKFPKLTRLLTHLCKREAVRTTTLQDVLETNADTVKVMISHLRGDMVAVSGQNFIETNWGKGVRLSQTPVDYARPKAKAGPAPQMASA
jgi:DNA-binding response OmpR family regulator